jgi:mannosyltransferase OCH1-like enzyme
MTIPKIIHHIAPKNIKNHHPIWKICYESWLKEFPEPEYRHMMWNDEDDIDNLVKNNFLQHWKLYSSFPFHILKIDFSRLCILYEYGGIYADMDMFCYENFYSNLISSKVFLIQENKGKVIQDRVQNSLMCAVKNSSFFLECMNMCNELFYSNQNINQEKEELHKLLSNNKITEKQFQDYVWKITGPHLLSEVYLKNKEVVSILPKEQYNPNKKAHNKNIKTKHMETGMWGKDALEHIKSLNLSFEEVYDLDISKFNFYKNYNIMFYQ